jgi:zinc/manganese transport system substrate-binding protein
VRHADLYLRVGAGLDYWSDELLSAAGRESLVVVDCSRGILLIDEPVNADHGHVSKLHSAGNPHYWLAPSSIPRIAQGVCGGLQRADPQHYGEFAQSLSQFLKSYQVHFSSWTSAMLNCHGARIVTYHRLWDYFARDFGMEVVGTIEPHPGAEPSPESLALLEETIHEQRARLIIYEPFESQRWAKLLARDTGISIVRAPLSAQSTENTEGILGFFDQLTTVIGASCAPQHP